MTAARDGGRAAGAAAAGGVAGRDTRAAAGGGVAGRAGRAAPACGVAGRAGRAHAGHPPGGPSPAAWLSIVVPALNEADAIVDTLRPLAPLRARGVELLVVDGGSRDGTAALAAPWADAVLQSPAGRARQMNAGAAQSRGRVLLFLHADTRLPADALPAVEAAIARGAAWGRFDVRIDGRPWMLRVVAAAMNARSRLTGIATGDQAIFVRREVFDALNGFAELPLMEDVELCRRLRRQARPACLRQRVVTSGRRWERRGVWRTIWLMWSLRWRYWRGESAEVLAKAYR